MKNMCKITIFWVFHASMALLLEEIRQILQGMYEKMVLRLFVWKLALKGRLCKILKKMVSKKSIIFAFKLFKYNPL